MYQLLMVSLCFLNSCNSIRLFNSNDELVSAQLIDRNGFSETLSQCDRLQTIESTDFLSPQPYQKVVRIYGKSSLGRTLTKMNLYHTNGQPWKYLEIENGRAHGKFLEWYPNGQLKIDAFVIEGTPDLSDISQLTWLFDQTSYIYNEKGSKIGDISYEKGFLEGCSYYFYENGIIEKEIPYSKDEIHGTAKRFDLSGNCIETIIYKNGLKHGDAYGYWNSSQLQYKESYDHNKLIDGAYYNEHGEKVSEISKGLGIQVVFEEKGYLRIQYQNGVKEGQVQKFNLQNQLTKIFHLKDGMKEGEEWEYYLSSSHELLPKLYIQWHLDNIDGVVKTWYTNGALESQKEMSENKKQGLSYAWFEGGNLMFIEEYEEDCLKNGSYFGPNEKSPISKIKNGNGIATLFDKKGKYSKTIHYEKGIPYYKD